MLVPGFKNISGHVGKHAARVVVDGLSGRTALLVCTRLAYRSLLPSARGRPQLSDLFFQLDDLILLFLNSIEHGPEDGIVVNL